MGWKLKRRVKICKTEKRAFISSGASTRLLELETAKEILAEIFLIRPAEVEEMIQRRLEERNMCNKGIVLPEKSEGMLWPATFSIVQ